MGKLHKTQSRKPQGRRSSCRHRCSVCGYTSSRHYNIERHEFRIHAASTRPRKCCDLVFRTKGEYYLHCEENHPGSRPNHITSRKKYKILPGTNIPTEPMSFVTSSPKRHDEMRYMLRSRAQPKTYAEDTEEIELPELASPKSETSDEGELDDKPPGNADNSSQSSGYGTKTSINSTFDSPEESRKMKLSFTEERDKRETPPREQSSLNLKSANGDEMSSERSTCLDLTSANADEMSSERSIRLDLKSENAAEISSELSPVEFCTIDETTAGHGGTSPQLLQNTLDELNVTENQRNNEGNVNPKESSILTENPERSNSNAPIAAESKIKKITSANETMENFPARKPFASAPHQLPPKKRILQILGFSNRENIANGPNAAFNRTQTIGDRLGPAKPPRPEESPLRRKRRLSRKLKARKLRETINLSRFSSASSDDSPQAAREPRAPGTNVETGGDKAAREPKAPGTNVEPGGNVNARKPKAPETSVDLRTNGRFCWEKTTRLMREYLRMIDFDSFKVILP